MRAGATARLGLFALAYWAFAPADTLVDLAIGPLLVSPCLAHPLGTDDLGRDFLAAVLQAARTAFTVAAAAAVLAPARGSAVGLCAGLGGPILDEALMRTGEIVASLPVLLLAILVAALFGGSNAALVVLVGGTRWPLIARLVRIETIALSARPFVRAAVALGASPWGIARRHLLPALAPGLAAASGIVFGGAILTEPVLALVGLGDPQVTSLGQLIANGFALVGLGWWLWLGPTAMLMLAAGLVAIATAERVEAN